MKSLKIGEKTSKIIFVYALLQARASIYSGKDSSGVKQKGPSEFFEQYFFLVISAPARCEEGAGIPLEAEI